MQKFIGIGNLTRSPESRETSTGKAVCNFTIAINGYNDAVDFIPVVVWGTQAKNCAKYLTKGSKVAVVGELKSRSYEDKDGNKRSVLEVVANEIEFLTPKSQEQEEVVSVKRERPPMVEIDDDALPF